MNKKLFLLPVLFAFLTMPFFVYAAPAPLVSYCIQQITYQVTNGSINLNINVLNTIVPAINSAATAYLAAEAAAPGTGIAAATAILSPALATPGLVPSTFSVALYFLNPSNSGKLNQLITTLASAYNNPSICANAVIINFINRIINIILWPVFTALIIIMFMWAGYLFLTAQGDSSKIAAAKKAVIFAVVGIAVGLLGYFAYNTVKSFLIGP